MHRSFETSKPNPPRDTSLSITSNFPKLPKQFSQWGTSCSFISAFGGFSYSNHYRVLKCLCTDVYFFPVDLKLFSTNSLFYVGVDVYVCLCAYVQRPEVKLSCSLHMPFTHVFWKKSLRVNSCLSPLKRRKRIWVIISTLCHHPQEITSPDGLLRVTSDKRLSRYPLLLLEISYLSL